MIATVYSRRNPGREIADLVRQKPPNEPLELRFEPGDYRFSAAEAFVRPIYISNACTIRGDEPPIRRIGVLIENASDVTLVGRGTTFWFEERMTEFAIQNCRNVTIRGITVNFPHPSVFEFDVVRRTPLFVEIRPVAACRFAVERGRLSLPFDKIPGGTIMQARDARRGSTVRVNALSRPRGNVFSMRRARRLANGDIRFAMPFSAFREGLRYQLSNPFRDGVGTLIDRSERVTLERNTYRFMHGLGIAAQLSRDIAIRGCDFTPDYGRDLTTAAAADMIHASMCLGRFEVADCRFDGARDDVINVHGVHFQVTRVCENTIDVAFCHRGTFGFLAFDPGDALEFVDPNSLGKLGEAKVCAAQMRSPRETRLTLDRAVEPRMRGRVVENVTKACGVLIDGIDCRNIPTRGILVTTRGKVVVQNCRFHGLPMANILIADDARSWYESGRVTDVTIRNNVFDRCGTYAIDVLPETRGRGGAVHRNIRVLGNTFILSGKKLARFKRAAGVVFSNNIVRSKQQIRPRLIDCSDVRVDGRPTRGSKSTRLLG